MLPESKLNKGSKNFENIINTIITRQNNNVDELFLNIDYQKIFNPYLASIVDIQYQDFLKRVKFYNSDTFVKWINNE